MLRFAKKNSAESGYNKSNGGEQHILYMDGPDQKAMNNKIVKACLTSCTQMTHVFVYGTLKKGQPNYHRMFDTAKGKTQFLASARTVEKYPLVIAGECNIPFLLNIPGEGRRILGEIYGVDERMLEFLDAFEGVPAMYQRTTVKLEVVEWVGRTDGEESPSVGSVVHAFIYSTKTYQPDWPTLPNYDNYDSYGDHGLDYVTREARD